MTLKEAISKRKLQEASEAIPPEIRDFVNQIFGDFAISIEVLRAQALEEIRNHLRGVKKGDKGDTIVGPPGPRGEKGEAVIGPPGPKGDKGDKPVAGVDFPLPKDGRDGSPDTPPQIAEKLNTLKEAVDFSVIKGLEPRLAAIIRSVKEKTTQKGGGVANVYHETFSISAGTSSITTAHPIGAGGNAIFKCAYQGQELDKDVHFTVGSNGRTITFDSAVRAQFQNNTTVSITYIRG